MLRKATCPASTVLLPRPGHEVSPSQATSCRKPVIFQVSPSKGTYFTTASTPCEGFTIRMTELVSGAAWGDWTPVSAGNTTGGVGVGYVGSTGSGSSVEVGTATATEAGCAAGSGSGGK